MRTATPTWNFGYYDKFEIPPDPTHEEPLDIRDWMSEGFDLERFDLDSVNPNLAGIRW